MSAPTRRLLALSLALLPPAGCSPSSPPDGADAGPARTMTRRALLPSSTRSLLLDPFTNADASYGHFVVLVQPRSVPRLQVSMTLERSFVSQSPAGVSAPVASLTAFTGDVRSAQIVAPFPGGAAPLHAHVWASVGDAAGKPVSFDAVGAGVTAFLLPNDALTRKYPLTVECGATVMLGGRQWVKLALESPAVMRQGGWLAIAIGDPRISLQLQAPEVAPVTMAGVTGEARAALRTSDDRASIAAYLERVRTGPRP